METDVLVAGEQVHQGARNARQAFEVAQPSRIHVDAAQAFPVGLDVADAWLGVVEALGTAAQAAAHVEVFEDSLERHAADSWSRSEKRSGMATSRDIAAQ
ncbi:hypothetical protein D9M69_564100 [compost metagenome]